MSHFGNTNRTDSASREKNRGRLASILIARVYAYVVLHELDLRVWRSELTETWKHDKCR